MRSAMREFGLLYLRYVWVQSNAKKRCSGCHSSLQLRKEVLSHDNSAFNGTCGGAIKMIRIFWRISLELYNVHTNPKPNEVINVTTLYQCTHRSQSYN